MERLLRERGVEDTGGGGERRDDGKGPRGKIVGGIGVKARTLGDRGGDDPGDRGGEDPGG